MTSALLAQEAVEVLISPDPDPILAQVAVEALILQHVDPRLAQVAVEVMTREGEGSSSTPLAGEATVSLTGTAALSLGASLAGTVTASLTGAARLDTGTHLAAVGRIDALLRGRLAGAAAPSSNSGNFFLLF